MNKKMIFWLVGAALLGGGWVWQFVMHGAGEIKVPYKDQAIYLAEQGRDHLDLGVDHPPYSSIPPTSGWHTPDSHVWGVSKDPIPDEIQVHNLEHGGIMIQYKPGIDKSTGNNIIEKLEEIGRRYKSKVIVAPYPKLGKNIALTAWTYLDKFNDFDENRIVGFIAAHIDQGPEFVPD
ncbi:hypothetical protein A3C91_02590 [Candidatus Azambacteria bacterium RIFCSPHIGHO2_02_FULL_52_12]|uniref:DUF3105 domain-containing protein n=1 Tax=Candidatus Azambacteria bacterium RIFCSPLOWO2_01_FULL_46_25 TaxID=1797298 RepID=A0A1F5BVT5_9BACT|nr:MAG: hypothetical protein A3C91_02590 [Candidatus Azambacteria bacterium RIFCSPHIGHO2_02_FULL_52_12]OGD34706.1 MAG: hypothetical protein A2988_04385 [Candidatus Azambacteria bacterium RIFCSPLOWO2_01_FULL_46_25]OGD37476.1 MAG: hypothetical protein A2850_02815 [Candidatus Azambacteria bacterium RIFCSPHIGHO2_01_FULL_51_74]